MVTWQIATPVWMESTTTVMAQLIVPIQLVHRVLLGKVSVVAAEKNHHVHRVGVRHQIKVAKKGCIVRSD